MWLGVTEVWSNSFGLVLPVQHTCQYVAPSSQCYYNTLYYAVTCFHHQVWYCAACVFSVLWVYSKFGHHPRPLGYICAKLCLFLGLHCWASPWRKITYSVNHSHNHLPSLFDARGREAKRSFRFGIIQQFIRWHNMVKASVLTKANSPRTWRRPTADDKLLITIFTHAHQWCHDLQTNCKLITGPQHKLQNTRQSAYLRQAQQPVVTYFHQHSLAGAPYSAWCTKTICNMEATPTKCWWKWVISYM